MSEPTARESGTGPLVAEDRRSPEFIHRANEEAWETAAQDMPGARKLANELALTSAELGLVQEQARAHRTLGYVAVLDAMPEAAVAELDTAERLATESGDTHTLATIKDVQSFAHHMLSSFDRAFDLSHESRELFQQCGDQRGVAWSYHNVGMIYQATGDAVRAEEAWKESLRRFYQLDYPFGRARLNQILGDLYREDLKQPETALDYYRQSLECGAISGSAFVEAGPLLGMGITERELGRTEEAADYLCRAEQAIGTEGFYFARIRLEQARLQRQLGNPEDALVLLTEALSTIQEDSQLPVSADIYHLLSSIAEDTERYGEALEYYRRYHELESRIMDSEAATNLRNAEIRIAIQRSEDEARIVREKNAQIQAEKEKTDAVLRAILPLRVAEDLKDRGSSPPVVVESASVLFTDFVGFTAIARQTSPEALVDELDYWFGGFEDIVRCWHVEKLKTIGDAFMAVGGVPDPRPRHAVETVMAALQISRLVRRNAKRGWGARIGVNSGRLVAGVIGKDRYAFDVWGDTVNVASRMESLGPVNAVLVSPSTMELVADWFDAQDMGTVEVRNRGAMRTWVITGLKAGYRVGDDPAEPSPEFLARCPRRAT